MKLLKILLWVVLVLLVVYLILCLVAPKKLEVERHTVVKAAPHVVFAQVNDLAKWDVWSPWKEAEPTMEITHGDKTEGIGGSMSWKSRTQGSGSQTIVESEPYAKIRTELKFDDWDGTSYADWEFEELGKDSTKVTWAMDGGEMSFFARPMTLFMKSMVGDQYDKGLANLSEVVDALPKGPPIEVFQTQLNRDQWILTMPFEIPADRMKEAYSRAYLRIGTFLDDQGLETVAAPVGIYHSFTPDKVVFEAGMPINDSLAVPEDLNIYRIPPTTVVTATCVGPYSELEYTHAAINKWIAENRAEVSGSPWEVYMNNESDVEDPSKLITQVFYPIKEQVAL